MLSLLDTTSRWESSYAMPCVLSSEIQPDFLDVTVKTGGRSGYQKALVGCIAVYEENVTTVRYDLREAVLRQPEAIHTG